MDAAEYKHVVLGLIFLKYISDAFEEKHAALEAEKGSGADPEDPDEYRAVNIFWVPPEARWSKLKAEAKHRLALARFAAHGAADTTDLEPLGLREGRVIRFLGHRA